MVRVHFPVQLKEGTFASVEWEDADKFIATDFGVSVMRDGIDIAFIPKNNYLFVEKI